LNAALGEIFADAVFQALKAAHMQPNEIDLIGSHGQTIWHAPDESNLWGQPARGTLQLGEPAVIAARTNIPVVADFRPSDLAVGGQGAPLVAFADEVLFGQDGIASGVLNLGGIANLTVLSAQGKAEMAFDTGPANMVLDGLAQILLQQPFDRDGAVAARGRVDEPLLEELLSEPYFRRSPPKTTGRELFGQQYVDRIIHHAQKRELNERDLLATATALTAYSIGQAYERFVADKILIERLILGGGGSDNSFLVKQLRFAWPHPVNFIRHETLGISTKFKESLLFALLAFTTYYGIPNNVPGCTGAKKRLCLGKIIGATP